MASSREFEIKLTAPAAMGPSAVRSAIASAKGVGSVGEPVVVELDATYYDTSDLRLASGLVTLRRREGGTDEGWHLKLPGDGFRTEITEPLTDDGTPPAALGILVSAYARGKSLVPVARIRTTRTAFDVLGPGGERLAEVADDDVRTQSFGSATQLSAWREIEVELKDTDSPQVLRLLTEAILLAGAHRSVDVSKLRRALGSRLADAPTAKLVGARQLVAGYLTEQATALLRADPAVRADLPDSVHSARVAIRRIRSAVRVFGDALCVDRPESFDERLGALGAVLGRARDAEVQRARLEAAIQQLPADLVIGPVAARILDQALPDGIEARRVLLETLQSASYYSLLDDVLRYFAEVTSAAAPKGGSTAEREVLAGLRKAHRRLVHEAAAAIGGNGDAALHRARKSAKRLRYAAEAVRPVYGAKASRLAASAEKVQEVLGEHQDSVVMRDRLRSLAVATEAAPNESAFTFGLLYGLEIDRAEESLRLFKQIWRDLGLQRRWPS